MLSVGEQTDRQKSRSARKRRKKGREHRTDTDRLKQKRQGRIESISTKTRRVSSGNAPLCSVGKEKRVSQRVQQDDHHMHLSDEGLTREPALSAHQAREPLEEAAIRSDLTSSSSSSVVVSGKSK